MQPYLDVTPEQIDFFEQYFGPYPFESYGIAMTDVSFGGAMEEQGRSLFGRSDFESGELGYSEELLLSHELGHQWFGDAVAPARWRDIWLNESFASYAEWMWLDHAGYIDLAETAAQNLDQRQNGSVATGDPTVDGLFGYEVYEGGAVVLHALRSALGDDTFFEVLQRWVADNVDTSRTSDDFIALTEEVSGRDMTQFFDDWLYATDLPDRYPG
jgi:aminopeptidase N